MIHRIYVEKQPAHRREARALAEELRDFVQIASLEDVRILHRYDVEGVPEDVFRDAIATVFPIRQSIRCGKPCRTRNII